MAKILAIILTTLTSLTINATKTVSLIYNYKHLDFTVGYNDGNHNNGDKIEWYYKGMSEQLHQYIQKKIENGALNNKKFNISFWLFPVSIYECCPVELSQSKNGYYVSIVETEPPLVDMVEIINYFTSEKWESFVCKEPKKHQNIANATLFTRMDSIVGKPNLNFFKDKKTIVFDLKDLNIIYEQDSLVLTIDNSWIDVNINFTGASVPPTMLGNYYIIATDEYLYVYDKTALVNSHKRQNQITRTQKLELTVLG